MASLGPEMRWAIAAVLLGLAGVAIHLARRWLLTLLVALAAAPLPAFLFLRMSSRPIPDAPDDQVAAGTILAGLACYLAPALGALTAWLVERMTAARSGAQIARDEG